VDQATIDGCRAKVERAEAAAQEMNDKWLDWVATNPYRSHVEQDAASGEYCLLYDFSKPDVPLEFPVLLGEITHDLRSALDHLAWREAVEFLGRVPSEKEANQISFPIQRTRKKFEAHKLKKFVDDETWTIMERYQPYDRGKPKRSKALELLHWINRMDKHRFIHGSRVLIAQFPFKNLELVTWNPEARLVAAPISKNATGRVLLGESEISRYSFDPDRAAPEMQVIGTPPLSISLGAAPKYIRSLTTTQTAREVRKVVEEFAGTIV
jgi:hypothetical protein